MNAVSIRQLAPAIPSGSTAGLRALARKDITEWRRGRRAWIVAGITTSFMALTAANAWITTKLIEVLPADGTAPNAPGSLAPMDNLGAAISAQIFILAAIFAVASLLVRERETGTLAWVASKPVSRSAIWLSKWATSTAILAVTAVVIPFAVTAVVVTALYGPADLAPVAIIAVGSIAVVAFYAAVGLAASTALPGQVPVVVIGFAVFAFAPIVAGLVPPVAPFLPTAILDWSAGVASGAAVSAATPVAWLVGMAVVIAIALRRLDRVEL